MTVREEPQRNANYAYLCATCLTLTGSPNYRLGTTLAAGISGMTGTALTVATVGPGLSLSTYLALVAGGGSVTSSSITASFSVLGAALTTGKAVAIVGGAGVGVLVGSAANCASVGVAP